MTSTTRTGLLSIYKTLLPDSWRGRLSRLYHNYRYPGYFFNTRTFENAWLYFNFCRVVRPLTYARRTRYRTQAAGTQINTRMEPESGFTLVGPEDMPGLSGLAADARQVFRRLDLEDLRRKAGKKPFLIQVPLEQVDANPADSAFLRFAIHPALIEAVAGYLGMLPVLQKIVFHYSPNDVMHPGKSQYFHIDEDDYRQVKAFLYVEDVFAETGPLCVIPAAESRKIYNRMLAAGVINRRNHKVDDDTFYKYASPRQLKRLEVRAGTLALVDTSSCWHYGSRMGSKPRFAVLFKYVTPFASGLPWRWRKPGILPFSHLGRICDTPSQMYVLGAK